MAELYTNYEVKDITCKICCDMLTNARDLPCGHTFCLHCLQTKCPDQCPECKEKTVLDVNGMKKLKLNSEKNKLVRIEITKRSKQKLKPQEREKCHRDMFYVHEYWALFKIVLRRLENQIQNFAL